MVHRAKNVIPGGFHATSVEFTRWQDGQDVMLRHKFTLVEHFTSWKTQFS